MFMAAAATATYYTTNNIFVLFRHNDVSAFSSSSHFGDSFKVEAGDVFSYLIETVLYSKVP